MNNLKLIPEFFLIEIILLFIPFIFSTKRLKIKKNAFKGAITHEVIDILTKNFWVTLHVLPIQNIIVGKIFQGY